MPLTRQVPQWRDRSLLAALDRPRASGARWLNRALGALCLSVLCTFGAPSVAPGQTPTAPANGDQVTEPEVVLRWALSPEWGTVCIQLASRAETSYPGGPFLRPDATDCDLDSRDVAYLLEDLELGRYYWHVQAEREQCAEGGDEYECRTERTWGPTAYFDSVEPPPPPPPTGCSTRAAEYFAENELLPFAAKRYRSYYRDITDWVRAPVLCRDLTGDGDREMIVRLICCTGGSLSPWAIFKHDASGQWRMSYAQVRDTVFRLKLRRRLVRTMLPAPYEGACTRFVRYREVSWRGSRFRSSLTKRSRTRRSRGC